MRKFSLAALAVLSALSLAACNSTSTDKYKGAAEGPKGFKSAEVRFQAHPEAMTRHQADELSERTDGRHLFVFGSKDDEEEAADEKAAGQEGAKDEGGAAAAAAASAAVEKEAGKAQRTEAGFKSSEIRFQEHPEQMTGQKAAPAKKELTFEQQARLEAKRAEQAKREAENDKVAEESERTESGFRSAEPRYQWNPEEATGKPRSERISREEKYRDAAKRAGVEVKEKKAATAKTEEELEAEAVKKESNKFGFRSAEPRYQWKPEDASK